VPTLLEVQRAMRRSLLERDDGAAAHYILADGLAPGARLDVYRNTASSALTTALRLSYPVVYRLVGAEFFAGAASIFAETEPPRGACLDEYGAGFAEFLARFPPAVPLAYLPGVARLEWAVTRALRAAEVEALDLSSLAAIEPADQGRLVLLPDPSIGFVQADHPVDAIWRAVLAQDQPAMAAIDLGSGPVWLLVQRAGTSVDVMRISEAEWRFAAELWAGRALQAVLDLASGLDAAAALAGHLAAGRFAGFRLDTAR
jgi:Putative DNA-binding domain